MLHNTIKRFIGTQDSQFLKKFYKKAAIKQVDGTNNFTVTLDGRNIRTPKGHIVSVPSEKLALAIAHEFNMQDGYLKPATMPLLSLARSGVDIQYLDDPMRPKQIEHLVAFLEGDTVKVRDEDEKLFKLQNEKFGPVIDFVNQQLNIQMEPTQSLLLPPTLRNDQEKQQAQEFFDQYNDWQLLGLEQLCSNLKSTALAIYLEKDQTDIKSIVDMSYLEENFQIEQYGLVEGSHDLDLNTTIVNVSCAKLFLDFCKPE